jgi:signal transduction histidine kinase
VRTWATIDATPHIVIGVPLPAAQSAYFQAFDESDLRRTLDVLRSVLIAAATATTLAGALLGWWASRRLTAPLRAVGRAATQLAEGHLETQLPAERDRELAGLVDSFNAMVHTLRERIQRDAAFAGNISHELRSPLTTLSTSMSVLRSRRGELSERSRAALDLVTAELTRFERLVSDLLEISHADAQTHLRDAEPVRIAELVLNLLGRPEYAGIQASFDAGGLEALVLGDKRRLQQALSNVLDNAQNYAGGATAVTIDAIPATITIFIDDAGPGVPIAERDHIFDRFARGKAAHKRASHGGSGLGLALVREHLRAHGGTVNVVDLPDGTPGARFVIELPRHS